MGAKYNWKFLNTWVEWTPLVYFRVNYRTRDGYWSTIFEQWCKS